MKILKNFQINQDNYCFKGIQTSNCHSFMARKFGVDIKCVKLTPYELMIKLLQLNQQF